MRTIIVEPYDPAWPMEFARIREWLWPYICDLALDIVHVGSTAVPGLAAKPIIDFAVVMESYDVFPALKARLEALEYEHEGDLGLPTREAFKGGPTGFMEYHMYVCPQDGPELRRWLLFRDWLRDHDEDRDAYAALKLELAERYPHDIEAYTAGKSELVEGILKKCMSTPSA